MGNTIGAALGAALTPVSTPLIANGTELAQRKYGWLSLLLKLVHKTVIKLLDYHYVNFLVVDTTSNVLGNINETSESLKEQYNQLTALLDTVRADLQQLQTNCSTSTVSALCAMSLPNPNSFSTPVNFSTVSMCRERECVCVRERERERDVFFLICCSFQTYPVS